MAIRRSRTFPYLDLVRRRRSFLFAAVPPLPISVSIRPMVPHEAIQTAIGEQPTHVIGKIGQAIFAAIAVELTLWHRAARTYTNTVSFSPGAVFDIHHVSQVDDKPRSHFN